MLLHDSVAVGKSQTARETAAELAKRLPVAVAHEAQVHARLTRRPLAEVELADPRQVGGELLRRNLLRGSIDPDRPFARRPVMDAVDEVPCNGPAVVRASDASGPAPCRVARVVTGRLVHEA